MRMLCVHTVYLLRSMHEMKWLLWGMSLVRWVCMKRYICSLKCVYVARRVHSVLGLRYLISAKMCHLSS